MIYYAGKQLNCDGPLSICRCLSFHTHTHSPWKSVTMRTHTYIYCGPPTPFPEIHLDDMFDKGHLLRCMVQCCSNPNSREK